VPANLTPEYLEAEERYRQAVTLEDKLAALREMLRTIPKHKGTEKMQAEIKRRISRLRAEMKRRPAVAKQRPFWHVEREGAGQVLLVGPPNAGKSSLLASLTNASPEVAPYPFTTRRPMPGMLIYEQVQIQLVDTPPLCADSPGWLLGMVRNADGVCLVADLGSDDLLSEVDEALALLDRAGIQLREPEWTHDQPPAAGARTAKRAVVAGCKADAAGASDRLELLGALLRDRNLVLPMVPVCVRTGEGLDRLRSFIFLLLNSVRVYTKAPGQKPDLDAPYVLPRGSTVMDLARAIHKELAAKLKCARVWGRDTFDGQLVDREYVLRDGDVVELRT